MNTGIAVDAAGNVVAITTDDAGAERFFSPNSAILDRVKPWPSFPPGSDVRSTVPEYVLTSDDMLYIPRNTYANPNRVFVFDLRTGKVTSIEASPKKRGAVMRKPGTPFSPESIGLDSANDVYLTELPKVLVLRRLAPETLQPLSVREVDITNSDGGGVFSVDSRGGLYFASPDLNAIVIFDAEGHRFILKGRNTGLNRPEWVAIDAEDHLYVANREGPSVTVYSPNARGNARPLRTLSGDLTKLKEPLAVALDAKRHLYVLDGSLESNTGTEPVQTVYVYDITMIGQNARPISSFPAAVVCGNLGL